MKGPDYGRLEDHHEVGEARAWAERPTGSELERRLKLMAEKGAEGTVEEVCETNGYLQNHARSQVLDARLRGARVTAPEILEETINRGRQGQSNEAAEFLDRISTTLGGQEERAVEVKPMQSDQLRGVELASSASGMASVSSGTLSTTETALPGPATSCCVGY